MKNTFWNTSNIRNGRSEPSPVFNCDAWNVQQVDSWIRGLDECVLPYIHLLQKVDGTNLLDLGDDTLKRMGISKEPARKNILHGISLLSHYSYSVKHENLQSLAMLVTVSVSNLHNAILMAIPVINTAGQSSRSIDVLNNVLRRVSDVYKDTMQMILWLDRTPFVDNKAFVGAREEVSTLVQKMVECVNDPSNPDFFNIPQVLVETGKKIKSKCEEIMRSNEPEVLYTSYYERVLLRKSSNCHWGFNIGCTCVGVHLITLVNLDSPAGLSGKIDAGDELVEINGTSVVGWKHTNVMHKLQGSSTSLLEAPRTYELELLICKRPRESWTTIGHMAKPKNTLYTAEHTASSDLSENQTKMVQDFKMKIRPDLFVRGDSDSKIHLRTGRSLSLSLTNEPTNKQCDRCSLPAARCPSFFPNIDKRPLSRRASVWTESPPATLRSPFDRLYYHSESNAWLLLLASWGENRSRGNTPSEKTQLSVGNGKLDVSIEEEEEDSELSEAANVNLAENEENGNTYAEVQVITEQELQTLNIMTPVLTDAEWNSLPVQDITGLRFLRRIHLESSGSAVSNMDSPLSALHTKLTRFFYGDTSSDTSATTPAALTVETPKTPLSAKPLEIQITFTKEKTARTPSPAKTPSLERNREIIISAPLVTTPRIQTVVGRGNRRLAPLAEPDEIGDLSDMDGEDINRNTQVYSEDVETSSSSEALRNIAMCACHTQENKLLEGWIRRQVMSCDKDYNGGKKENQWVKCWMLLHDQHLLMYSNQFAKTADIVVDVTKCNVSTIPAIRTSKKNVFLLSWDSGSMHFSPFTREDMKCWLDKITSVVRDCGSTSSIGKSSEVLYVRPINMLGFDSVAEDSPLPFTSNTLPRPTFFNPTKLLSRVRQGSLSRFRSNTHSQSSAIQ